jgi:hypothetical protein
MRPRVGTKDIDGGAGGSPPRPNDCSGGIGAGNCIDITGGEDSASTMGLMDANRRLVRSLPRVGIASELAAVVWGGGWAVEEAGERRSNGDADEARATATDASTCDDSDTAPPTPPLLPAKFAADNRGDGGYTHVHTVVSEESAQRSEAPRSLEECVRTTEDGREFGADAAATLSTTKSAHSRERNINSIVARSNSSSADTSAPHSRAKSARLYSRQQRSAAVLPARGCSSLVLSTSALK